MKPYYQDSAVTIYLGDCLGHKCLEWWLSGDILVCDPPFGIGYNSGWQSRMIKNDNNTSVRDEALKLWRSDKPGLIFGHWSQPKPVRTKLCLTWDKGDWPGMGDLTMPWGQSTEEIYVIGDGFIGQRSGTVIRINRIVGNLIHPNEKPVALFARLFEKCPPGIISDPFMGSGTTLRAAKDLGRKAIGIEIEEKYCEIAAKRMEQECFDFCPAKVEEQLTPLLIP